MIFYQPGRAHSLREIEQGLRSCEGKLSHLGIEVVGRSSLSYVNGHRPWQLYQNVFRLLYARCQSQFVQPGGRKTKKFRFKNKLVSLDSSVIDLCLSMYDWAKFRTTKGAIKLHLLLDHDGYLPSFAVITTGKVHDVTVAKTLKLQPGTIIVAPTRRNRRSRSAGMAGHNRRSSSAEHDRRNALLQIMLYCQIEIAHPTGKLRGIREGCHSLTAHNPV